MFLTNSILITLERDDIQHTRYSTLRTDSMPSLELLQFYCPFHWHFWHKVV